MENYMDTKDAFTTLSSNIYGALDQGDKCLAIAHFY